MNTFTAGMIKTFLECPQKYNLIYNEHIDLPSGNSSSEIGKKIHTLINYKLKGCNIEKILEILNKPENISLKILWDNFLEVETGEITDCEYTFNVSVNEKIRLTGRVDAIRKNGNKYEILDWKTGSSKNTDVNNDLQTIIYLYSIYKYLSFYNKINNFDDLSMTYYFLKEKTSKSVFFTEELFEYYKMFIINNVEDILKTSFFDIKSSKQCLNCKYSVICKHINNDL